MSVQHISVMVPPPARVPRGAVWLGEAVSWLLGGGAAAAVRAGVHGVRARVAGDRAVRREASERAALMALAGRYQATQPEFAKDLFAAANDDRGG